MSLRTVPSPARLLFSVMYREERDFERSLRRITERMGAVGAVSDPFPFDRTDYYEREMGSPLFRRFLLSVDAVSRDELAAAKLAAEAIEREFSVHGRRTVNIDPGLLAEENLVLATGKNYSHRVYLRDGVFADLTLVFEKGEYRALPWTYPDYASTEIRSFLTGLRRELRETEKPSGRGDS
jgi:hypothetical protein